MERKSQVNELRLAVEAAAIAFALRTEEKITDCSDSELAISVSDVLTSYLAKKEQDSFSLELFRDEVTASLLRVLAPKTQKRCPNCGGTKFYVTAHVTQDWLVDGDETFLECSRDCVEVTHRPDDDDLWQCALCGYDSAGRDFNQKTREMD